jgi:protein TonB
MATPRELGGHRILKELSRDALGATFRAAGAGAGETIGDLLLLRTFEGLDDEALERQASGREQVWPSLPHAPFLALSRGRGSDAGVFFLVYDYRVEVSFERLLEVADQARHPLSPELAVLVTDRVGQALVPLAQQATPHGFVVPGLVHLSSEGDVRLLGAEIGPALRRAAGRYPAFLAPELRRGAEATESEQVYSLGALLFTALTGAPPTSDAVDRIDEILGTARLADDGTPLPDPLLDILHRSLAPSEQRIQRVETWQQALKQTAAVTGLQANPFQLAMYMHRILERRLEREPDEIAAERRAATGVSDGPLVRPSAATGAAAAPPATPASVAPPATEEPAGPPRGLRRSPVWIAAGVVALLGIGGLGWMLLDNRAGDESSAAPAGAAEGVAAGFSSSPEAGDDVAAAAAEPGPTSPSPATPPVEDLEAQIDQLVTARERELSAEHEERRAALQAQLQEARKPTAGGPEGDPDPPRATRGETTRDETPDVPAGEMAGEAAAEAGRVAPGEPTADSVTAAETADEPASPPAPAATPTRAKTTPPTATPQTRRGDLVLPSPDVRPPRLQQFPEPDYPAAARRRGVEGTVVLKLLVDQDGQVEEVEVVRGVTPDVGLDAAAVRAAQRARFTPATKDGVEVKTFYTLTIPFSLSAPRQ